MSECITELVGTPQKHNVGKWFLTESNNIGAVPHETVVSIYLQSLECVYCVHRKSLTKKNLLKIHRVLRFYLCCNDIPV